MKKFFLFIAVLCCATMLRAAQYNDLKTIQSGGVERQYFLYVPDGLKPNSPLFISCHEGYQTYQDQKTLMKWLPLAADTANIVVVFPAGEAVSGSWGNVSSGWDMDGMKDVNFMLDIIDAVKADYNIDDTRVYMTGYSMGGAFAYYMAQKAPDRVAAVVSFSGYDITGGSVSCSRPIPIFHLHGQSDDVMQYPGLDAYLKQWRNLSHCSSQPVVETNYPCPAIAHATLTTYIDCDCEVEVKLLTLPSLGHDYSGFFNYNNHDQVKDILKFCKQYNTGCGKISPEEQGIKAIREDANLPVKVLQDDHILIKQGDRTYTLTGQELK